MPIYDFKCPKCHKKKKDVIIKSDEDFYCTRCDILMIPVFPDKGTFILKGEGWFKSNDS